MSLPDGFGVGCGDIKAPSGLPRFKLELVATSFAYHQTATKQTTHQTM